jgi:hypothetical protein
VAGSCEHGDEPLGYGTTELVDSGIFLVGLRKTIENFILV